MILIDSSNIKNFILIVREILVSYTTEHIKVGESFDNNFCYYC